MLLIYILITLLLIKVYFFFKESFMIHLTKKWVRQNLITEGMHPLFIKTEFIYSKKDLIAGMISADDSFGCAFETKDGRQWLMFTVSRVDKENWPDLWNIGRRYIMILHDADDLCAFRAFVNKSAVQEWLYTYFKQNITLNHLEIYYQYI